MGDLHRVGQDGAGGLELDGPGLGALGRLGDPVGGGVGVAAGASDGAVDGATSDAFDLGADVGRAGPFVGGAPGGVM
jgi:hypothetical protein